MPPKDVSFALPSTTSPLVVWSSGRAVRSEQLADVAVFPGSFNPLHEGHRQLRQLAERRLQRRVVFEISLANVDKADIDQPAVARRLQQFAGETVVLTREPRFLEKSVLFPGCPFVVGFDTAVRLLDSRFYDNSLAQRDDALRRLQQQGHRFLVGGRLTSVDGCLQFGGREQLPIPKDFDSLFEVLAESEFRVDVSSTQLRAAESPAEPRSSPSGRQDDG